MKNDLESSVSKLRQELGGLVDDATLRRIILEEGGIVMANEKKIADFKDREEVSAVVKVTKIADTKDFTKRTGGAGRVRNITIEDDSGSCRLTLWDEDVDLPKNMDVQIGTQLKLSDCYVKQTDFGTDISKGKKGKIEKTL